MKKNEKDKEKQLIFGRYKIINKLDEGAFGQVYLGMNIKNNEKVAIKLEPRNNKLFFLETEAYFLFILKGLGIPKIETYGHNQKYNILVETLLGKSLQYLFYKNQRFFNIKDVLMMGIQMVQRLKFIHSKYIIHRDIKPENFLIGNKDPYLIYLIDFGLSKKYRSSRTGKHVQFSIPKRMTGTARFSSLNALKGYQVSRRDDLESIAYILIFFMKGGLPWENVESLKKGNKYREIYKLKVLNTPEKLCQNLPSEICEFLKYTRSLDFEQEPNYEYCCSLFNNALIKIGSYNDLFFSWIKDPTIINKLKKMNDKNLLLSNKTSNFIMYDKNKRKSSPQTRLYHNLQDSFERKRLHSFSNTNNLINSMGIEDKILSSDQKYNEDEHNDLRIFKKLKNDNGKLNSIITNETSNINYKINDNNSKNSIYKFESEKELQNFNFKILTNINRNNSKKLNTINIINNINSNTYQSYSEIKNKKPKNNIIIEKIDKKKFSKFILRNKNYINTTFNTNNNGEHNFKIDNIELAQILNNYDIKAKIYKSNNNLKNISKNNTINNISNINDENLFEKKKNKNNKKENNIIRITNIYKAKNNDKKNFLNIIPDKNSKNDIMNCYTEKKILINNNSKNKNRIDLIKNTLKANLNTNLNTNKLKSLNKDLKYNFNKIQNNNQLLLNKPLINPVNSINQGYNTFDNFNNKSAINKYLTNKNANNYINNGINKNIITKIQNTNKNKNKNKINRISNSFEQKLHEQFMDISNDAENQIYNYPNLSKNKNNTFLNKYKNNELGINENKNKDAKNKSILINSIISNNNKLKDLKQKQNRIFKNTNKNISNFLNYRIGVPNYQKNVQENDIFQNTLNVPESNNYLKKEKNNNNNTQNKKNLVLKKIKKIKSKDFNSINYMQNNDHLNKENTYLTSKLNNFQYSNIYHPIKANISINSSINK